MNVNDIKTFKDVENILIELYNSKIPVGTVMMWCGSYDNIPDGWLLCDGSSYSISKYPELWEVLKNVIIGKLNKEVDNTSFNVPNFVGKFPLGAELNKPSLKVQYVGANNNGKFLECDISKDSVAVGAGSTRVSIQNIKEKDNSKLYSGELTPPSIYINYIIKY